MAKKIVLELNHKPLFNFMSKNRAKTISNISNLSYLVIYMIIEDFIGHARYRVNSEYLQNFCDWIQVGDIEDVSKWLLQNYCQLRTEPMVWPKAILLAK